ncbi:MAG: sigma-70 family RNA polymerase sigma factor [Lachnospiraceae bacterium]|nr:sigma-70 family RNA polymerase sigma factor [Lachnospiraceae bacterium]
MRDYSGYSDEELIALIRDGDDKVTDLLMDRYKNLVRKKAGTMFILGADRDDLIQEGMVGLFKAVRDYDSGRDASFETFAQLCILRQLYTAVKNSNRKKHGPLNAYVSFYSATTDESGREGELLLNRLSAGEESNPESMMITRERAEHINDVIENNLSPLEREVLDLYITGMSTSQIAGVLGRDPKSTDNALQRLRGKLKKLL